MKRNRWLILMGIAVLGITSASAQNDWDFDDIYNNQKQVQEQRKAISAREKAERERLARERRQREEEWARANRENSRYAYDNYEDEYDQEDYYDDPSDRDIDAYNRRGNANDSLSRRSVRRGNNTSKQYASRERGSDYKTRSRSSRGRYTDRIARFHDPSTIVVQRGNSIVIYTDEDYYGCGYNCDQCSYYGGGDVNIYFGVGCGSCGYGCGSNYYGGYPSYYPGYYSSYYPWYSPWYGDPYWYYVWYGPSYPRYRRHGWWGYSSWGWGWGSAWDYYSNPYYAWHNGYRQGFIDGYYSGYYGSYGYDPYVGSYYRSVNRTPNGRRNNEYYGAAGNSSRNNGGSVTTASSVNQQLSDRETRRLEAVNETRGNYWTENANRVTDNTSYNPREYRPSRSGNARGSYGEDSRGNNSRVSSDSGTRRRNESVTERPARRGSYDGTTQQRIDRSQQRIEQREVPSRSQRSQYESYQPQRRGTYDTPSEPRRSTSSSQQTIQQHRSFDSGSSSQSSGSSSSRGSYDGGGSSSTTSRGRR